MGLLLLGCPPAEICTDGRDNDGNAVADCDDRACADRSDCRGDLVLEDVFVDRHYWFEEENPGEGTAVQDSLGWGGDLDGDGLTDITLSRYRLLGGEAATITADVVVVPSSGVEDPALIDVDGAGVVLEAAGGGAYYPSYSSLCDIDGDGFDDLVQIDTWAAALPDVGASRPLSLSLLLGGPPGPGWPGQPSVLPLGAIGRAMQTVHCAGDMDGDGLDDLVLSAGSAKWLLDGVALAAGTTPDGAVRRRWDASPDGRLVTPGDLDGDGYDDLFFRDSGPWDTCYFDDMWRYGSILPGGPHLLQTTIDEVSIYEEGRPAVELWVEAQATEECISLASNISDAQLADLDGDGRAEFIRFRFYGEGKEGWRGTHWGDLTADVRLSSSEATLRGSLEEAMSADIDSDGALDLVVRGGGQLVPGSVPWGATWEDEVWGSGLAVYFGAGSVDSIELERWQEDVLIVTERGLPFPRIVEDRDGDGLLEIGYVRGHHQSPDDPLDLPTAAFIPGSALLPFKR